MFKDQESRKQIGIAIILAVLAPYLVDPVIKWFAHSLMWLGENVSVQFTRNIYSHAAMGFREQFSFELLGITLYFGSIVTLGIPLVAYSIKKRRAKLDELEQRSELEYLTDTEQEATAEQEEKEGPLGKFMDRIIFPLSCVTAFLGVVLGLGLFTDDYIELQLNASFNQRTIILASRASEQQIKELRATWAQMESRTDYEHINDEMADIAKSLDIKLPKLLWP
jgi:hypothetical protein